MYGERERERDIIYIYSVCICADSGLPVQAPEDPLHDEDLPLQRRYEFLYTIYYIMLVICICYYATRIIIITYILVVISEGE